MEKGKIFHSPFFLLKAMKSLEEQGPSRFSVSVSKKVAKGAVLRNKIRRRTYSALQPLYNRVQPGFRIVLIAKNPVLEASLEEITTSLDDFFVKTGLLK
jgi:ribonuclease P protein component